MIIINGINYYDRTLCPEKKHARLLHQLVASRSESFGNSGMQEFLPQDHHHHLVRPLWILGQMRRGFVSH